MNIFFIFNNIGDNLFRCAIVNIEINAYIFNGIFKILFPIKIAQ